jgi:carbamoyltransferase
MKILGLHASFNSKTHDPSIALIDNGELLFAAEEERYLRYKTSSGRFPEYALKACLDHLSITIDDIDFIAVDGETYPPLAHKVQRYISDLFGKCPPIQLVNHATCHIYGALYMCPFHPDLVISIDGCGDSISSRIMSFIDNDQRIVHQTSSTSSLGNFYTAFTNYLGFKSIEGEYKVMGMSAYSSGINGHLNNTAYFDKDAECIVIHPSLLDESDYSSIYEPCYNSKYISELVHSNPRGSNPIQQIHYNIAGEVQHTFENAYIGYISHYVEKTRANRIALTGGCALNVLANLKLQSILPHCQIYVLPFASDRGLSVGSAAYLSSNYSEKKHIPSKVNNYISLALGKSYSDEQTLEALNKSGLQYNHYHGDDLYDEVARLIQNGNVIGWFQGRSEFGPRALGFRSIIADAKISGIKDIINLKIKYREKYRPFAPAVLWDDIKHIDTNIPYTPYMTKNCLAAQLHHIFGETVHFDGTARVQTVDAQTSPYLYTLLNKLKKLTDDIPCLVNTSFNLAAEPIVESPSDALRTFISSGIDCLAINNYLVMKSYVKAI